MCCFLAKMLMLNLEEPCEANFERTKENNAANCMSSLTLSPYSVSYSHTCTKADVLRMIIT